MKKLVQVCAILILTAGYTIQLSAPAQAAAKCEEIKFTKSNYQVNEVDGQVAITVKREVSPFGCPGQLVYSTADDTATAPYDYTAISEEEFIFTSEDSFTFNVSIVNDVLLEGPERFKVSFTYNDKVGAQDTAWVTIADNRQPTSPPPPAPPPPSTSGTTSSTSSSSSTGSTSATTKTTQPRSSTALASPSPTPTSLEEPAESPPVIEESSESVPTKVRSLGFARPRATAEGGKKLWAFLMVVLIAAAGVILVAWRQRENSKQNFSTLAS